MKHFSSLSLAIVVSLISLALATAAFYSSVFLAVVSCFFVLLIAVADYSAKSPRPLRSTRSPQEMSASASSQALRLAA
jgi:hypothetical protein